MELFVVKILCLIAIFIAMLIAALIPLRLILKREDQKHQAKFLSYSNCVAGGVFLGTCFIGLFPTVKAKFTKVLQSTPDTDIPVAELTIMSGYFLMLFMEQIAHAFTHAPHGGADKMADSLEMKTTIVSREANGEGREGERSENSDEDENEVYSREAHPLSELGSNHHQNHSEHHGHSHDGIFSHHTSPLRRYMLLLALSIHSIFEGSALGLQETMDNTIHLFVAIMLHEVLVAFAFGVSLAKLELKRKSYLQMILFFCLMIPIGVGIGIAVGRFHGFAGQLTSAIMQGLAAGTFIYVVFVEILPNELVGGEDNVWRILCVFGGFMVFAALQFITLVT